MVSDLVIGSLIGGGFSIAGYAVAGWSNLRSTQKRIEADRHQLEMQQEGEKDRRRAEFFLGEKVEALTDLFSALERSKRTYIRYGDRAEQGVVDAGDYDEVVTAFESFQSTKDYASLFLSDTQYGTIIKYSNELYEINGMIEWKARNPHVKRNEIPDSMMWDRLGFLDKYENAKEMLKDEVNEPIRMIE